MKPGRIIGKLPAVLDRYGLGIIEYTDTFGSSGASVSFCHTRRPSLATTTGDRPTRCVMEILVHPPVVAGTIRNRSGYCPRYIKCDEEGSTTSSGTVGFFHFIGSYIIVLSKMMRFIQQ